MAKGVLTIIPILFNIGTIILCLLVLFSGLGGHLTQISWLSTYSGNYKAPAKLSSSNYLTALTKVSKTDYVGTGVSAASLGLPDWTTIHTMTVCSGFHDGRVECSKPKYGFAFKPWRDMRLDGTPAGGSGNIELNGALSRYSRASSFLSGAQIVGSFFSIIVAIQTLFNPLSAAMTGTVITLLLFAASITATVLFKQVSEAFNSSFGWLAILSQFGNVPVALEFAAAALALLSVMVNVITHRRQRASGVGIGAGRDASRSLMNPGGDTEYQGGGASALSSTAARSKTGLFNRAGGGNHKYVQIGEQQGAGISKGYKDGHGVSVTTSKVGHSPDSIRPTRLDDDWAAPDEYHAGGDMGAGAGKTNVGPLIPLTLLGNKQIKDLDKGFEPYRPPA
ncbi:hypothetical protein N0V88_006889 [Collariella sp. IMI 366227]|nr:hypothetical protein N0V88_006889 [Collariella sp. IMI 366227]